MPEVVLELEYGKRRFEQMDGDGMLEHVEVKAVDSGEFLVFRREVLDARFRNGFPVLGREQRVAVLLREFPQVFVHEALPFLVEFDGGIEASFEPLHVYFPGFPVVIFPLDEGDFADSEPAIVREVEKKQIPEPVFVGIFRIFYAFEDFVQLLLRKELDFVLLFSRHTDSVFRN